MGIHRWIGGSGEKSYNEAGNWDGGVPEAAGDVQIFSAPEDCEIINDMDHSAVDLASWKTGKDFRGRIATPGSPLKLGTVTEMRIASPRAVAINLWPSSATECFVAGCGPDPEALQFVNGTLVELFASAGELIHLASAITATSIYGLGANLLIDSGAAIANILNQRSNIKSYATVGTSFQSNGGVYRHCGIATADLPDCQIHGGILFIESEGGTITKIEVHNSGRVDGNRESFANTVTDATVWAGGVMAMNMATVHTNPVKVRGGDYLGPGAVTIEVPRLEVT